MPENPLSYCYKLFNPRAAFLHLSTHCVFEPAGDHFHFAFQVYDSFLFFFFNVRLLSYVVMAPVWIRHWQLGIILSLLLVCLLRQLHTPTNFLLLSLAVSDFLISFLMLFQMILLDGCWFLGDIVCGLYYFMDYTITSASIGTMVLISVDRYVAICDPLRYRTTMTQKRLQISITLCWTCSAIFQGIRFKDSFKNTSSAKTCFGQCTVVLSFAAGMADMVLSFLGPVSVVVVLYIRVFSVVVSQSRAIASQVASVTLHCSLKVSTLKSEMRAATTLGLVVVAFLICVCPYFCHILAGQSASVGTSSTFVIVILFYMNSFINPLIYATFYSWFRKSVKLIVTLKILKAGYRDINMQ